MPPPLLHLRDIGLRLGTQQLLDGAELAVGTGDRIGLVGRNGSGKSTLLRIAAGLLEPESGSCFRQPNATVQYLAQEPDLSAYQSVFAFATSSLPPNHDPHPVRLLLEQVGLTGDEAPSYLSGGEIRRAALVRALAPAPDLLLLDEPTNHLDLPAIEWLEGILRATRAGLVLISHDRRLLERLTRNVVWLDNGVTRRLDQGFGQFETWRDQELEAIDRAQHKLGRQIAREEDWMRYGVTARRKRNMRRVHELAALRDRFRQERRPAAALHLGSVEASGSGKLVSVAEHLGHGFNDKKIVRDLNLRVLRGDRLGIVGPNGAGKTTLLRLLTGDLSPQTGKVTIGTALQIVTLDQQRRRLDPAVTLAHTLTGGGGDQVTVRGERRHVVGYMQDFLFRPEQARTPVGKLSGGERGRLMLACALAQAGNLLVLDEPTNDLDLETLDMLQDYLADYQGTVILVSHDRDFLDRVVTSTLAAEGNGVWTEYAGGYSDMLSQRGASAANDAAGARTTKPHGQAGKPAQSAPRRKLGFKEKHLLETLPAEITRLQNDIAQIQAALEDADLYRTNSKRFTTLNDQLMTAQTRLAQAEEQWLELEILREALEASQ